MSSFAPAKTLTLSELTGRISEAVTGVFAGRSYWVVADVSNHTFYPNKEHHYFELVEKDEAGICITARMQAVAWRAGATRIGYFESATGQRFRNGIKASLKVQVDYHNLYGLKLVVQDIDPAFTIGQLELHRQATVNRLLKDCAAHVQKDGAGFRTSNNRLAHRCVIQRIAVLASSSSAGYQDFMHTLHNNGFGYRFYVSSFYTSVQGEANAEAAVKKIEAICCSPVSFDTVVIIRGGGSDSDFLLFDQYVLCAAVAGLQIPVITGIGHLKNQTLVDLVAHTSTNAPTKAAEYIIAHNRRFETAVLDAQRNIVIKAQQILARHNGAIVAQHAELARKARALVTGRKEAGERLKEKIAAQIRQLLYRRRTTLLEHTAKALHKPQLSLAQHKNELNNSAVHIKTQAGKYLSGQRNSITYFEAVCRMMSPVNLLRKGFALVYHDEKIVTDGSALEAGTVIKVRLQDSELLAAIKQKEEKNGEPFDL